MKQITYDGLLFTKPTRKAVENLKVGDLAPDCFGRMNKVTSITYHGDDIHGKAYVGYYVEFGDNAQISGSLKEDEILATVPLTAKYIRRDLYPKIFEC